MLRAELLKIRSHKLPWIVFGIYAVLQLVNGFLAGFLTEDRVYDPTLIPFFVNAAFGLVFTFVFAGWMGGAEFGWATWRVVLGRDNRRSLHFWTKIAVLLIFVAVGVLVAVGLGVAGSFVGGLARGATLTYSDVGPTIAGAALFQLVYALVGFGLGMATRSTAVAISVGIGFFLVVQQIAAAVSQLRPFMLSVALTSVTVPNLFDGSDAGAFRMSALRGWLTILGWLLVAVGVAWVTFTRRDLAESG